MQPVLNEILALKNKEEFMDRIRNFIFRRGLSGAYGKKGAPLPRFVESIKEIGIFELNVTNGGTWLYLAEGSGSPKALLEACNTIGAAKTEEYLSAVLAHFPNRIVPDDIVERLSLLDALEVALNKEDERFPDAVNVAVGSLQRFLIRNLAETEKQFEEFWEQYSSGN